MKDAEQAGVTQVVGGGALGRLVLAINHYVTTSDVIGSALAQRYGTRTAILIPVNPTHPQGASDIAALQVKLEEIGQDLPIELQHVPGDAGQPDVWVLGLDDAHMDDLARALTERPGALGWGSPKRDIDRMRALH